MRARFTPMADWLAPVLVVALGLGATSCAASENVAAAGEESASPTRPAAGPAGEAVLARVGEVEISEADVTALVAAEILAAERQRHEALERGLEQTVANKLIELEAAARGISGDELVEQEVTAKVQEPDDAAVDAFYEARKAQIRQPKEQVAAQIRQFLSQQAQVEAREELIAGLKAKHGFTSYLEPFRVPVETAGYPVKGPAAAPVTIVEFSDFECPYCSRVVPTLEQVLDEYGDKVRVVFRQFPLNRIHPNAQKAAEASLCAHDQQKFWEMHDAMFDQQRNLAVADLKAKAEELGLDAAKFGECLDSGRHAEAVNQDLQAGTSLGVTGTPALFINGRFLAGAQPYEAIAEVIDEELASRGGS